MKEYLSPQEASKSRSTTRIIQDFPNFAREYCAQGEKILGISGLYTEARYLQRFFAFIAESESIKFDDIDESKLESLLSQDLIEDYLNLQINTKRLGHAPRNPKPAEITRRRKALYNYCEYLVSKKVISSNPVVLPKPEKRKKVIHNPNEVKFHGNAKIKTTVDGKYSIIKEHNPNKSESKYLYQFKDEEKDCYFTDEAGNILSIIAFEDARNFIKELYGKKK